MSPQFTRPRSALVLCRDVHLRMEVRQALTVRCVRVGSPRSLAQLEKTLRLHAPDVIAVQRAWLPRMAMVQLTRSVADRCPILLVARAEQGVPEGVDALLSVLGKDLETA